MNIRKVLQSGGVKRFHAHIGIDNQLISDHSWGVALLLQHIYPNCTKYAVLHCLTHDNHEYLTGDVPAPVKWESPELVAALDKIEENWEKEHGVYEFHEAVSKEEKHYIKLADMLEGMWFCILQLRLGHVNAKRPFRKWSGAVNDYISKQFSEGVTVETKEFLTMMVTEYEDLTNES